MPKANSVSSPTIVNGKVYVGGFTNLYALDAKNGTKIWEFATGSGIDSSPAVAEGVVYVGSNDYNLYAVDAVTGTKKWVFATGGEVALRQQ
ncbi:MAG: PQQ-binding-like beta-propeller repeat protein [Spirosomataceae bacterium]